MRQVLDVKVGVSEIRGTVPEWSPSDKGTLLFGVYIGVP